MHSNTDSTGNVIRHYYHIYSVHVCETYVSLHLPFFGIYASRHRAVSPRRLSFYRQMTGTTRLRPPVRGRTFVGVASGVFDPALCAARRLLLIRQTANVASDANWQLCDDYDDGGGGADSAIGWACLRLPTLRTHLGVRFLGDRRCAYMNKAIQRTGAAAWRACQTDGRFMLVHIVRWKIQIDSWAAQKGQVNPSVRRPICMTSVLCVYRLYAHVLDCLLA